MIAKPSAKWYRPVFAFFWIVLGLWGFQVSLGYGDPGPEYLAQTMECEWDEQDPDDELVKLARQLDYNPVKIYNWVYANIYHPAKSDYYYYSGSRIGARVTFRNRRGNHWDTSSLLIALLRISGIPARYVKFDNSDYVFVEAWLPRSNYRGAGSGADKGWVPLAPWYKEYRIVEGLDLFPGQEGSCDGISGIPCGLEFDFEDYLSSVKYKTPLELFEESIQAYLRANCPGKTLKDIPRQEILRHTPLSILPGQLPAEINFSGTRTTYSEVPEQFRSNITLRIKKKSNRANLFSEYKVYLPQIAGKRFGLDWVSAGSDRYKPVLKIDGQIVHGNGAGDESIGSDERYYVAYIGGGYNTEVVRPSHEPGTYMQIALDPLSASFMTIEKLKNELHDTVSNVNSTDVEREADLGLMGAILAETFLARLYEAYARTSALMHGEVQLGLSPTFIYALPGAIPADEESKFYLHPQWNIDAQSIGSYYKQNGNTLQRLDWNNPVCRHLRWIAGYEASFNEARIFEDWMDTLALSTIKGIMVANEELNIEVAELDGDDIPRLEGMKYRANFDWNRLDEARWDTLFNYFLTNTNQSPPPGQYENWKNQFKNACRNGDIPISYLEHLLMPDYIPTDSLRDETIDDIIAFIQAGEIVTAPLELIRYKGMRGYVMLTNGPTSDGYLFNMDNGGKASATVEYNPYVVDYSSIQVSSDVPAQVASQWQDTYATSVQGQSQTTQIESSKVAAALSAAGDPVNMVNGEFYQQEKPDIFIPSRGFNLAITRKYKSQLIYNGPFGYGWAWNHAERLMLLDNGDIKYYDNECTAYEIKSNGDGTYQYPPGLMIRLETARNGYTITMLKANIRLFFSDTGLLTRKEDAFGNTLTFLYTGNNLTTIRDALNRDLTLHYKPSNQKVERITDFTGRSVRYDYNGDDLIAFTDLENNTTRFEYLKNQENELNNHNMSKYILPNGDYLEIGYYKNDQVAFHRNKKDETFNFHYSRLNRYGETWNEEGYYRKVFFDENNNVVRIANEDKTIEQMTYDDYHNMIAKTDANGYTTVFDYYPAGGDPAIAADRNLYKVSNALSEIWQFRYDDSDNPYAPSEITDPAGRVTRFEYYPNGRLHKKIQAPGYELDQNWNMVERAEAPGFITEHNYDAHGNLTEIIDVNGHSVTNAFDNVGLYLISTKDKNGHVTNFDYYLPGNPESMPVGLLKSQTINTPLDPQGYTSYLEYNQYNQKTLEGNALGEEVEYRYDINRKLTHIISPNGATTENIYDSARDIVAGAKIIATIDPLGHSVYFKHDKLGNVIDQTDRNGNATRYAYDGLNRLIRETDPLGYTTSYEYDGTGNLVTLTDKRGNLILHTYDPAGRLTRRTDPEGHVTSFSYYADGKLQEKVKTINNSTLPSTVRTYHEYNALGQLTLKRITRPTGNQVDEQRSFQYRYDALDQLKRETHPEGNFVEYDYDGNGNLRLTKHYDRSGVQQLKQIENIYYADSRNLLKQVIVDNGKGGSGAGTTYEYDAVGRTTAEIDPVGDRIEYTYDAVGNLTLISNPAGIAQHFYDVLNRRIRTIDAMSGETVYQYDSNGNTVLTVDAERNETYTWFDAMNRMIGQEDAAGAITTYNYDGNGNLVDVNDPNQGNTSFRYDRNNRRIKIIRPMTETVSYTFDGSGNLATVLDAKNQKTTYDYGIFNQVVTARYYSAGNHATPLKTVTLNYDDNGNLTGYHDGTTSAIYTYDDLNRKTGESVSYPSFDKSYAYAYPNYWQTTFTGPDATTLTFNYDAALRLTGIQIPGQGTISYRDHFWNAPTSVELPGGNIIEYDYDNLMRPEFVMANDAQQQLILSRDYLYSAAGNILEADTEYGLYMFDHDRLHRLESATNPAPLQDESYTYDALGNRKSAQQVAGEWTYNPNNELESYGDVEFEYDDNGNLTTKTESGTTVTYGYDIQNRLVSVSNGTNTVNYYYDPFGRRLWKEVNGQIYYYFYSEEGLIAEIGAGGERHYGYLPASDWTTAPLYKKEGISYYWYLNDHLGTPQKMISTSGQTVWSAKYDSFSNVHIETASIENNLRLPGQYYDVETGLHYNWHRYYDPSTGRYLRLDPAEDGLNLYIYAANNPVIWIDPRGLMVRDAWDYTKRSADQLIRGNYTDEVTILGTGAQIGTGLIGLDLPGDIRDVAYDIQHWEWSWSHTGQTALDAVGILPIVGAIKYTDEVGTLAKSGLKKLSPSKYSNPDPSMDLPAVRYEPKTIDEVMRMREGKSPIPRKKGEDWIEGHHRQQVPVEKGGKIDELWKSTHRGPGQHSRHNRSSQLTPSQRSRELREHYKQRGSEYMTGYGEGI